MSVGASHQPLAWPRAMVVLGAALVAARYPDALALDRAGLQDGELWRLWTGHLVHWTQAHFVMDVGVACLLALVVRIRLSWLLAAPCIGAGVLLLDGALASYAGLSGLLHAWAMALALEHAARGACASTRQVGTLAVVAILTKLLVDPLGVQAIVVDADLGGRPVYVAHGLGVVWAALTTGTRWSLVSTRTGGSQRHAALGSEAGSQRGPSTAASVSSPSRAPHGFASCASSLGGRRRFAHPPSDRNPIR